MHLKTINPSEKRSAHKTAFFSVMSRFIFAFALSLFTIHAHAAVMTYNPQFNATDVSMWGPGASFTLDESVFLGPSFNFNETIGGFVGDANTQITPEIPSFQITPAVNIPATYGEVWVPKPTWSNPFAGYWCCRFQITPAVNIPAVYSPYIPAVYADTRTGAEITAVIDGRVGLDVGVKVDSGSVDATVTFAADLDVPDPKEIFAGNYYNFNPNSTLAGVNTLETNFSEIELSVDAVMQLSGQVGAQGCIIAAGCDSGSLPFNIDETIPVLSFNDPSNAPNELELLGLNFGPVTGSVSDPAGYVTVDLNIPSPDAVGSLDPSTQTLKASGTDDFVDLTVDIDQIASPGLFGNSLAIPGIGSIGYDIIDVGFGPQIDLQQNFELDPTLIVTFFFDKAVEIAGQLVTEVTAAWDQLPDIAFFQGITTVTPEFTLEAELTNETLLALQLAYGIDVLTIGYQFDSVIAAVLDVFGLPSGQQYGVGTVAGGSLSLANPQLYSEVFPVEFASFVGKSFQVDVIPLPGTLLLLLPGFLLFLGYYRRTIR